MLLQTLAKLRADVVAAGTPIFDLKKKRDCTHPNHATGISDAAPAFAWVNMEVGPLDMITSAREACEFFLNKVRKESKDKNLPAWMTWANIIRDAMGAVHDYVKENFKAGLSFNPKGVDYAAFAGSSGASTQASATKEAAAPAASVPTPQPAQSPVSPAAPGGGAGAVDNAALQSKLFAQLQSIDQSSGKTAGLRHVTKDMKSTANKTGEAVVKAAPAKAVASKDDSIPTGTARVELVDKRWYVEFQVCENKAFFSVCLDAELPLRAMLCSKLQMPRSACPVKPTSRKRFTSTPARMSPSSSTLRSRACAWTNARM